MILLSVKAGPHLRASEANFFKLSSSIFTNSGRQFVEFLLVLEVITSIRANLSGNKFFR